MTSPEKNSESSIGGISVRAIIVLFLILVFAIAVFMKLNNEALNSVVMAVIGWYFGQKSNGNGSKPTESEPIQVPTQPIYTQPNFSTPITQQCPDPSVHNYNPNSIPLQ
jgi:hypothetical protein